MKKLFLMLFLAFLLVGTVSAFEFDNVKDYDPVTKEVTITNAYGLGAEIGKARLNTPLNVLVPRGYQKVAEFDLWAYQDYNDALKQFTFTDFNNGKEKINRDYDLKYKTYEDVEVEDYNQTCNVLNGEVICESFLIGTHTEQKEKWIKITPSDLKKNDFLTIGVFTEVQEGDYVDWIPTIYGVKIGEWATWTEDLTVGLVNYLKLDNNNFTDSINSVSGTNGGTVNTTGIIKDGRNFVGGESDYINYGDNFDVTGDYLTINVWVYPTATDAKIIGKDISGQRSYSLGISGTNGIDFEIGGGSGGNEGSVPTGEWSMITAIFDNTDVGNELQFWINGTNVANDTSTGTLVDAGADFRLGQRTTVGSEKYYSGVIDEVSMWNRRLLDSEITQLYNSGSGITYTIPVVDNAPNITGELPVNNTVYTDTTTIKFNATVSDDINLVNVSLIIDGVIDQTNSSGINNSLYEFTKSFSIGIHNWSIIAWDDFTQSTQTDTKYINITIANPVISNPLPVNNTVYTDTTTIKFNATIYDSTSLVNVSLYVDGVIDQTNSSGINNSLYEFTKSFSIGIHNWSIIAFNSFGLSTQTDTTYFNISISTPTVTLQSPADISTSGIFNQNLIAYIESTLTIANVSLYIDGSLNETDTTGNNATNYTFNKDLVEGAHTWYVKSCNILGFCADSSTWSITIDTTPFIEFIGSTPANGTLQALDYITAEINLTETYFKNLTISLYNSVGIVDSITFTNSSRGYTFTGLTTGDYYLNATVNTNTSKYNVTETRTIGIDVSAPKISITAPIGEQGYVQNGTNITVNLSIIDSSLDSCWYTYYTKYTPPAPPAPGSFSIGSESFNCSEAISFNTTNFIPEIRFRLLKIYTNDTLGNENSTTFYFNPRLFERGRTYDTPTIETSTETFTIDTDYNSSKYSVITGSLVYDGTSYSASKTGTGDNLIFSKTLEIPNVDADVNNTFYWNFGLTNSTGTYYVNATSSTQLVEVINMSLCGDPHTVPFINFTAYDETTLEILNVSFVATFGYSSSTSSSINNSFSYSDTAETTSEFDFCIDPSTKSYNLNTVISIGAAGYVSKFYNWQDLTVTNTTTNKDLYLLSSINSTSFIVKVLDYGAEPVVGAQVNVQFYSVSTGQWLTSEIVTTSYTGTAIAHLYSEDVNYRFVVYQNGVNIYTSSSTVIICEEAPCTVTLIIPGDIGTGDYLPGDVDTELTYTQATNVYTYTYSDSSSLFSDAELTVYRFDSSNVSGNYEICSETSTSSSAVLTCDISSYPNGTYVGKGYITRTDSGEHLMEILYSYVGDTIYNRIGIEGVLWAFFLFIGIVMVGVANPGMGILMGILGIVFLNLLNIVSIGITAVVSVIAIGVILLIQIKK